ncbi:YciI family protein [Fodinibius sp. Rm-B-1B1-1]|uniref:YciI family protein n=1 Tax=Fodinibius alkaliphilus TaxID=3140241 RepID=UPI00315A67D1
MKKLILLALLMGWSLAGLAQDKDSTKITEPETFEMQEGDTTYVMQKYFMVFLKSGPKRSQGKEEAMEIQEKHLAYLQKMANEGKTSITGPMAGEGDIRGIVIYNTATAEEARKLAEGDPAVQAGRLVVEVHPWWAAKGSKLK